MWSHVGLYLEFGGHGGRFEYFRVRNKLGAVLVIGLGDYLIPYDQQIGVNLVVGVNMGQLRPILNLLFLFFQGLAHFLPVLSLLLVIILELQEFLLQLLEFLDWPGVYLFVLEVLLFELGQGVRGVRGGSSFDGFGGGVWLESKNGGSRDLWALVKGLLLLSGCFIFFRSVWGRRINVSGPWTGS